MSNGVWLSVTLAIAVFTSGWAESAPRDPIAFQPEAFSDFLTEMSIAPDVRVAIAGARLERLKAFNHVRKPIGRQRRFYLARRFENGRTTLSVAQMANRSLVRATAVSYSVDPAYFLALAHRESRFDHLARAPTSSASGLFQFTENTWLCVLRQYGAAYGIEEASAMSRSSSGRCRPSSVLARWRLLALRYDPKLNAAMAALHTRDNAAELRQLLGRGPSAVDLYAFHFFGADEGTRFLTASPSLPAPLITPRAASSNRSLFFDLRGHPRSVWEVRRQMEESFYGV